LHLPDILHGIMACIVAGVGCMAASLRRTAAQNFLSAPCRAFCLCSKFTLRAWLAFCRCQNLLLAPVVMLHLFAFSLDLFNTRMVSTSCCKTAN